VPGQPGTKPFTFFLSDHLCTSYIQRLLIFKKKLSKNRNLIQQKKLIYQYYYIISSEHAGYIDDFNRF